MGLFGGRKREKRLEEAGVNAQAVLASFREALTAKDEARRLGDAAARAKAQRKNGTG